MVQDLVILLAMADWLEVVWSIILFLFSDRK